MILLTLQEFACFGKCFEIVAIGDFAAFGKAEPPRIAQVRFAVESRVIARAA